MELYYKNAEHILKLKLFKNGYTINENIITQLNEISNTFIKKEIQNKEMYINNLIKYNVDGNWVDKINESKKFGNDSSSLECYIIRYGEKIGKRLFDEKLEKSVLSENSYIKKYGKQVGTEKWKELCKSKGSFSEQHFINKYGEGIGKKKWTETLDKKLKSQKENFKNKKWKNGMTLIEYQERYGIEDGYTRWDLKNKKRVDTLSRNGFIKRYGIENGVLQYRLYIDKMLKNRQSNGGYSKISQLLFEKIYEKLNTKLQQKCKYGIRNGEERFFMNNDKLILTDFKCGNKIIEFDGDYWHRFEETKIKDKLKQKFLESKGYVVLRIKESDYINNKQQVINKCINFINETA